MAIDNGVCNVGCKWRVDTDTKVLEIWAENPNSTLQNYGVKEEEMPPWRDYRNYIETINIDKNIINFPRWTFYTCKNATNINISEGNPKLSSLDGVVFNKEQTKIINCPRRKQGKYIIPSGVTEIGEYCFYSCSNLTDIIIPMGIKNIGAAALAGCSSLTKIIIPESVVQIGKLGDTIEGVFRGCNNLKDIIIFGKIEFLESLLFSDCKNLENIIIPNTITTIERQAFQQCTKLKNILFLGTETEWNRIDGIKQIGAEIKKYFIPEQAFKNNYKYITYLGKTDYFPYANDLVNDPSLIVMFGNEGESNQITWYTDDEGWVTKNVNAD